MSIQVGGGSLWQNERGQAWVSPQGPGLPTHHLLRPDACTSEEANMTTHSKGLSVGRTTSVYPLRDRDRLCGGPAPLLWLEGCHRKVGRGWAFSFCCFPPGPFQGTAALGAGGSPHPASSPYREHLSSRTSMGPKAE